MDEHTEPVLDGPDSEPAQTDPAERPVYRGPFRQPSLGTRIAEYERPGTEDFLAGEYRAPQRAAVCPTCRVPGEHCLCRAEPDRLRYALAQISLIHQVRPDGTCSGCGTSAALCGYLTLLDYARAYREAPPPVGTHLPDGV
jgi:hypothetical protein